MLDDEPRIKIKGAPGIYILMSTGDGENGPVTTEWDFANFVPGFGHMYDGVIKRYGAVYCGRDGWEYVKEVTKKAPKPKRNRNVIGEII